MPRKKSKPLTLTACGHIDKGDGRYWLSPGYANSRTNFKVVEQYIIGYSVVGDGNRAPVRIAPIYQAVIFQRTGKVRSMIHSHEIGDYYNPPGADPTHMFGEDTAANWTAASIRLQLAALAHTADQREQRDKSRKKRKLPGSRHD